MKVLFPSALAACVLGAVCALPARADTPNDFPTKDRVLYVQECMRDHHGPYHEMVSKCSCALDQLAGQVKYEDWVHMATSANAMTIGGERGGYIRDNDELKGEAKRYRELQTKVMKACFVIK